jgi:cytochrome c5
MWSRHAGSHADNANLPKDNQKNIYASDFKLERRKKIDEQYRKTETFVGIPLATLIKSYKPKFQDNAVILHFASGMAVPVPLDDDVLAKLDAFVALKICPAKGSCTSEFPPVSRDDAYSVMSDPMPIHFKWNKVVVSSPWHPDVPKARAQIFSPWRHVDSLTGLEFVHWDKYKAQFQLGAPEGEKIFFERCQFCHGVRQVGASFGWDVVTPLPLHEKRSPETLLNHVKYPKLQAREMGISMPTQGDVTADEMRAVWAWMKLAVKQKLKPY